MTNDQHHGRKLRDDDVDAPRRDFLARSVAAGFTAAAGPTFAATPPVVEAAVTIKTADGTCDAAARFCIR